MLNLKKVILSITLSLMAIHFILPTQAVSALSSEISFIILSQYDAKVNIGDEFYLIAITSTGKNVTWKSSDSKIVSVNKYGKVTAKKSGTAVITANLKDTCASCLVSVNKTTISINPASGKIQRGESIKLTAVTSNGSKVTWKSRKTSIATVDEHGTVIGKKPGETEITCSADGNQVTCLVTVDYPTVTLNRSHITLYRGQTAKLSAEVSSKIKPQWRTNKKSIATVDQNGNITAIKNGTAIITATVDGVSISCEIIVEKPEIKLSKEELSMKAGSSATITAKVSSGNSPTWSTSNPNIISINSNGQIKALKKGKAYVYAKEDGTKVKCTIYVTE